MLFGKKKNQVSEKEEIQTVFDVEDEFLKACIEDPEVEVETEIEEEVEGIGAVTSSSKAYAPRTVAPSSTNKNWLHYNKGGYNYCILISGKSVLPNCVGYAWGRWRELLGKYHKLSRNNAEVWYLNTGDGYSRSKTPKLGSVICWRKGVAGNGLDGAGHVAIVEKIYSDGSILTSNSAYGGTRFYTTKIKKPYAIGGTYVFQGFIHLPVTYSNSASTSTSTKVTSTVSKNTSKNQIYVKVSDLNVRKGAGTSYARIGYAKVGYYNYTSTKKANGYTWYQIATNQWIASNSSWTTVYPKKTTTTLKVGDSVVIKSTGNSRPDGKGVKCYGTGWTRTVLKIHSGKSYPYQIGLKGKGTTGYYKASALKKK